jgi:hypothetical protein
MGAPRAAALRSSSMEEKWFAKAINANEATAHSLQFAILLALLLLALLNELEQDGGLSA